MRCHAVSAEHILLPLQLQQASLQACCWSASDGLLMNIKILPELHQLIQIMLSNYEVRGV